MNNPICNASGVYSRTSTELYKMMFSHSGSFITKSSTFNPRTGNPTPSYWENNSISINSMGLPNHGYRYYTDFIEDLDKDEKHCFLSIANIDNDETGNILDYIADKDYIVYPEINVSCPNIPGKEQLAYNYNELDNFLTHVMDEKYNKPYGLKLPPFFDPVHFMFIANIINQHKNIKYLTCVNSVGNVLDVDISTNKGVIFPKNGLGGLGGDYILPVALSNVYQLKQILPNIDIIGCGGIKSGEDVYKHILVGASMVQIGTALNRDGPNIIPRILRELEDIMIEKGYETLDDFKGKYNEMQ
tara:strand:+ start:336 stop:1238 length:903 start_codon:yes stop_codon:yes gene_type:complete